MRRIPLRVLVARRERAHCMRRQYQLIVFGLHKFLQLDRVGLASVGPGYVQLKASDFR